jgi:hypothetical protein
MQDYMAQQQMGATPAPASSPAPSTGMADLGGMGGQMLQRDQGPGLGSQEMEHTPLNDRLYAGGEMTQFWKRLLLERQQARAAASLQYQRGQLEKNQHVEE